MQNSASIILSIRPKYVEAILDGSKCYEFRRTIFKEKKVERALIYSTSPVKKIVASFRISGVIKDTPDKLWKRFKHYSGLRAQEFFDYFEHCQEGYAIRISDLELLEDPLDPFDIFPGFYPPQSFCYLDDPVVGNCCIEDFFTN